MLYPSPKVSSLFPTISKHISTKSFTLRTNTAWVILKYVLTFLNPSGYCMYQQVELSKIPHLPTECTYASCVFFRTS